MPDSRQWSVHTEHTLGWILMYSLAYLIFNASLLCEQPWAGVGVRTGEHYTGRAARRINIPPIRSAL